MEQLGQIFNAIVSNEISLFFSACIAVIFILAVWGHAAPGGRIRDSISRAGAGLMTVLGVLGTFTGILIGLVDFDVMQIDDSVPILLEGLKVAFATSIVGMGAAITFRISTFVVPAPAGAVAGATPEDILGKLEDIRSAISSEGDSSLLTQIQKLRVSFEDGQKELVKAFRDFAETMAEQNSKALIEALEGVIRDFNTKLNEQFGENFKQLNKAVHALLEWQENYKTHVETMEARIEAAVSALEATRTAIENISERTAAIPKTLDPLRELMTTLQASITNLEAHLQAVGDLREKALEAFPVIERNIETLTGNLNTSITETGNSLKASVAEQSAAAKEASREMQEAVRKTQEDMGRNFDAFDKQMQDELQRALQVLGGRLAALSEKFVNDYQPLTERLREVLVMAERIR